MMDDKNKHIGSDFDDFLEEEGILPEVELVAVKRIVAFQIAERMKAESISKSAMAAKMQTSRPSLERLLDPDNLGVTIKTIAKAAAVLGKRVHISLS
jgi:hypothetical protein